MYAEKRGVAGSSPVAFLPSKVESWTPRKDAPYRSIIKLVIVRKGERRQRALRGMRGEEDEEHEEEEDER